MEKKRVIIMVLDGFGVGELPDASTYGDVGSNTLKGIYENTSLQLPNLKKLGLYNIPEIGIEEKEEKVMGCFGKAQEICAGKNSPVGHWEISGYVKEKPFTTYPNGFPTALIEEFKKETGVTGIIGNVRGSGTELLKQYGEEHLKTGYPIIYTSADSVFQIAAHENIVPVETLYHWCHIARKLADKPEYNIGTIIARPFVGDNKNNFVRTYHRRDYEASTFGRTMLDVLQENGKQVIAIGKIEDLFGGRGITKAIHTEGNSDGIYKTIEEIKNPTEGLIFTNLVDFDMLYGHRNDIVGYQKALEYFDAQLPKIMQELLQDDILIITADHGNDPSTPSTDHSREYTPILVYGKGLKQGVELGVRKTYADISATVLEYFGLPTLPWGTSFLQEIQ